MKTIITKWNNSNTKNKENEEFISAQKSYKCASNKKYESIYTSCQMIRFQMQTKTTNQQYKLSCKSHCTNNVLICTKTTSNISIADETCLATRAIYINFNWCCRRGSAGSTSRVIVNSLVV